jgi:hypothetical protein
MTPISVGATSTSAPPSARRVGRSLETRMKGTGVGGVRAVRTAGHRVNTEMMVTVVGGDDHGAALGAHRRLDFAQAGVHGFHRLDGRVELTRAAYHVGVGEVDDEHVELRVADGLYHQPRSLMPAALISGLRL